MRHIPIQRELEGPVHTRVHFNDERLHWVIRVFDGVGLVQEYHSNTEPSFLVYMRDRFSEKPVVRMYPSDEITKYRKNTTGK